MANSSKRTVYNIIQAKRAARNKWDWQNPINNIPFFIWGPIGVGKTWIIQQLVAERMVFDRKQIIADENATQEEKELASKELYRLQHFIDPKEVEDLLGLHMLVLRLAERPIEQLQGVPTPDLVNQQTVFLIPKNFVDIKKATWVVAFLDELDKADELKMAAATHFIEARRIGDFILPLDTFVIAAANRVSDSWISKPIVPELRNRAAHIEVDVDVGVWIDFATNNKLRPSVIGFHSYMKTKGENYLSMDGSTLNEDLDYAFPSPRTWHKGCILLDRLEAKGCAYGELLFELKQLVGERATIAYDTYMKLYSTVNIKEILDGTWPISRITSGDLASISNQHVVAFALCDQLSVEMFDNENWVTNIMKVLTSLHNDIRVIFLKTMTSTKEDVLSKMLASPACRPFYTEILNAMKALS